MRESSLPHLVEFLEYLALERGLSRKTLSAYRNDLNLFGEFLKKAEISDVSAITREHIREFLQEEQGRGMAEKSLARELVSVKAFFRYLAVAHLRDDDIAEVMTSPKLPAVVPECLSVEEVTALLAAYDNPPEEKLRPRYLRNRAALAVLYATGIRVSELCDLRVAGIDFQNGLMRVRGKGDKERMVPFDLHAAEVMQDYLRDGRPALDLSGRAPYLMLNLHGERMDRRLMWQVVEEAGKAVGITRSIHPHLLRHSFATHLLTNGADLRAIQELLGHASIDTTQVYLTADTSRIAQTFRKFHPRA